MAETKNIRLEMDGEELWWISEGQRERVGNLVRCFPATEPDRWVSIRSESGEELGIVRSLDDLDTESRATVEPILTEKYHVPAIEQIQSIEGSLSGKMIRVATDDGVETLDVNTESDVNFRDYPRIVITDRTKRRKFVIENADTMDKHSRDLIRRHLRRSRGRRGRGFR